MFGRVKNRRFCYIDSCVRFPQLPTWLRPLEAQLRSTGWEFVWPPQQRREHFLQSGDQVIGLPGAFGKVLNLVVLDRHLGSEKLDFAILLP
jgi:hypothetical protein